MSWQWIRKPVTKYFVMERARSWYYMTDSFILSFLRLLSTLEETITYCREAALSSLSSNLFEAIFHHFSAVLLSCNTASEQTRSLLHFILDLQPDKNLNIQSESNELCRNTYMLAINCSQEEF